MEPFRKYRDDDGTLQMELCWPLDELPHREDGPAVIRYWRNGQVQEYEWYLNGKLHREGDPAVIGYYYDGTTHEIRWMTNGKLDTNKSDNLVYVKYTRNGNVLTISWNVNGELIHGLSALLDSDAPDEMKVEMKLLHG